MRYIKCAFSLVLVVMLMFVSCINTSAKTLGQFKKELSDTEAKYSDNQSQKKQTESEISATKERINQLQREKVKIGEDIQSLNEELKKLAEDIEKMQKEIKSIVNYYQLSSSTSLYLEYVFNASSLTDFIYRLAVTEQLSEYRKTTIDKYNRLIDDNNKKISELASKQVSLNKLEEQLSNELTKLGENLASISHAAVDIKEEIADLKSKVKLYESYGCKDNEEVSVCENNYYKSQGNTVPSAFGFYMPVQSGRVNANYGYTDYYGSYHDGLDIGVSHGTTVYPIASGRVVKISPRSSCGGNMVYVTHTVNGKNYTSGYFHLASISVKEGQVVTYNTIIGYSGGDPRIEYWDGCSTGAHLHLQVGTGHYMTDYFWYSNYKARSFDPRAILNFPPWGGYFSGR